MNCNISPKAVFILINSGILRSSYDSVDFRYLTEGRWEKDILRQDFSALHTLFLISHAVGFRDLRSSLSCDDAVLKFRRFVLA